MFEGSPKPPGTKLGAWTTGMGIAVYACGGTWNEYLVQTPQSSGFIWVTILGCL